VLELFEDEAEREHLQHQVREVLVDLLLGTDHSVEVEPLMVRLGELAEAVEDLRARLQLHVSRKPSRGQGRWHAVSD